MLLFSQLLLSYQHRQIKSKARHYVFAGEDGVFHGTTFAVNADFTGISIDSQPNRTLFAIQVASTLFEGAIIIALKRISATKSGTSSGKLSSCSSVKPVSRSSLIQAASGLRTALFSRVNPVDELAVSPCLCSMAQMVRYAPRRSSLRPDKKPRVS